MYVFGPVNVKTYHKCTIGSVLPPTFHSTRPSAHFEKIRTSDTHNSYIITKFMMTSSNGNIFRVTGHLCREFTGPGEFPAQRPVTRSFDVFFDLRLNKQFCKQP